MKDRKLYWRRKENRIILEGKRNNKTIYIWTLPEPQRFFNEILSKSSYLSKEKLDKISEKINRLDYKTEEGKKKPIKVRTTEIIRSSKLDDKEEEWEEEMNDLLNRAEEFV
jgi:hypothetical protein|tara:strand:- start:2175 stop:2507 length:333 start_codon:yes stop_codon:yes gene_type:complete